VLGIERLYDTRQKRAVWFALVVTFGIGNMGVVFRGNGFAVLWPFVFLGAYLLYLGLEDTIFTALGERPGRATRAVQTRRAHPCRGIVRTVLAQDFLGRLVLWLDPWFLRVSRFTCE
jgi:hypothetical protein